jgi:hypothetical protein
MPQSAESTPLIDSKNNTIKKEEQMQFENMP